MSATGVAPTAAGRSERSGPPVWVPIVLAVLAVALLVTGTLFAVRAHHLDGNSAVGNDAVVDTAATTEVVSQVTTALNQVLSYDYTKPAVAQQAATRWLAGDAPGQYKLLFTELQKIAGSQNLVLVARVVTAGVTSLKGSTATLLVFVDQRSTRASDSQSSVSAAQVEITAHKQSGRWKITELKPI